MADFLTDDTAYEAVCSSHSRQSSVSAGSDRSEGKNETHTGIYGNNAQRRGSDISDSGNQQLILRDGSRLIEESGTEHMGQQNGNTEGGRRIYDVPPRIPAGSGTGTGTARAKASKAGFISSIPEAEIEIPSDGNLASFSVDSMATFLRCLRVEDRLIAHLHRNSLDGRKFGRLKDSDLDSLGLKNAVLVHFRDRTAAAVAKKPKQRVPFVL